MHNDLYTDCAEYKPIPDKAPFRKHERKFQLKKFRSALELSLVLTTKRAMFYQLSQIVDFGTAVRDGK